MGRHRLKAFSRKHEIIARSSAEAELYAAALGASEAKEIQSTMCDLGFAVKPVLIFDAKGTEHILHPHGFGKMKHIDVAQLRTSGRRRSAIESSERMRYPWATLMLKRT